MRRELLLATAGALLAGCSEDAIDHPTLPDAAGPPPVCIDPGTRERRTVSVFATVVWAGSLTPVPNAEVTISTAWDVQGNWPESCDPLVTMITGTNGSFQTDTLEIGSIIDPPILFFRITGPGIPPTASDRRVTGCLPEVTDCGNQSLIISVPTEAQATGWRAEPANGGMPNAALRGLVLFQYWGTNYNPAAGVTPLLGEPPGRELVVDTEVRFLASDVNMVAPLGQEVTLASGFALFGLDTTTGAATISGQSATLEWEPLGVLVHDGWIFVEDQQGHTR